LALHAFFSLSTEAPEAFSFYSSQSVPSNRSDSYQSSDDASLLIASFTLDSPQQSYCVLFFSRFFTFTSALSQIVVYFFSHSFNLVAFV
jgi:hypothetical protein